MTYRLYWRSNTGAFAPQAALAEAGAEVELVPLGREELRSPSYLALNPMGQVPTLILPDGAVMTESAAMLIHIAEAYPEARLLPPAGSSVRPQALRWIVFTSCDLYESCLRVYYAPRYSDDPSAAAGIKRAAQAYHDRCWGMVEAALGDGPFILGTDYSLADLYLALIASWHWEPARLFAACPRLARMMALVKSRPAIAPLWREQMDPLPGLPD